MFLLSCFIALTGDALRGDQHVFVSSFTSIVHPVPPTQRRVRHDGIPIDVVRVPKADTDWCQPFDRQERRWAPVVALRQSANGNDNGNGNEVTEDSIVVTSEDPDRSTAPEAPERKVAAATPPPQAAPVDAGGVMRALGTSPRRIFLSLSSAATIALAGNLFGVTSKLLEAVPEATVEASGLDTYFPRGKHKH